MFTNSLFINVRSITILIICIVVSGCATMFAPAEDEITIKTEPEGASVYDGVTLLGKTPLTRKFKRETSEQKTLTITRAGYKSKQVTLTRTLDDVSLFNFGFITTTSGATSWGIDALSGHMIKYSPDSYLILLQKKGGAASPKDDAGLEPFRFVILNQYSLMKDIAAGDGEYLRAFFEMRSPEISFGEYRRFLNDVSDHALALLRLNDPIEFYNELQRI